MVGDGKDDQVAPGRDAEVHDEIWIGPVRPERCLKRCNLRERDGREWRRSLFPRSDRFLAYACHRGQVFLAEVGGQAGAAQYGAGHDPRVISVPDMAVVPCLAVTTGRQVRSVSSSFHSGVSPQFTEWWR